MQAWYEATGIVLLESRNSAYHLFNDFLEHFVTWIFQGNPESFDIDQYVTCFPELIYWRTNRFESGISIGDRAILWRSGARSGAIAVGVVVEAPTKGTTVLHPDALGTDLWKTPPVSLEEMRTGIQLHEIRTLDSEGYLPRAQVKADPVLESASIIKSPQGTVFRLTAPQAAAFDRLWAGVDQSSLTFSSGAGEGGKKLVSHYRRERSRTLRNQKLEQMRVQHGQCMCELCGVGEHSRYPQAMGTPIFEVHHRSPLATASSPVRTRLEDLAVLCANCHRAVHSTADVEANYDAITAHLKRSS